MIDVVAFRTEGLGDSTYLLTFDGMALLVDPQRDIDRFLSSLGTAELRWVVETHLHNDYVSGGLSAARETGAELVLPASAAPAFRHTPAFHNEELSEGDLVLSPIHTPGHTPEHTSYVVSVDGRDLAVFSGGSLLVGSAGRSDLLGEDRAETLARLQYRSVRALGRLPAEAALYPTHGAGSFCTVSSVASNTSTVGREIRDNPVLAHEDEDSFVKAHLAGLQPYPSYYSRMGPINLAGPPPMPATRPPTVDAGSVPQDAVVVDIGSVESYADGHLPGSINIPVDDQFGTWFGWLVPYGPAPYLVSRDEEDLEEAILQLARIGVDEIAGVIRDPGGPTLVESRVGRVADLPPDAQILDVRSPDERSATAPGDTHYRYLPDLTAGPPPGIDPSRPVWVMCASGYRAAIGASLLRGQGVDAVPVMDAGIPDLPRMA